MSRKFSHSSNEDFSSLIVATAIVLAIRVGLRLDGFGVNDLALLFLCCCIAFYFLLLVLMSSRTDWLDARKSSDSLSWTKS